MTEDEAKTKWCPQYQVYGGTDEDDNRSTRFNKETKAYEPSLVNATCIGSACMMWRWKTGWSRDDRVNLNEATRPTQGYCGLAGKP